MSRTLPSPPAEVAVNRSLDGLAPRFRAKVEAVVRDLEAWGMEPWVFETIRTDERQAFLYGFGRTYDDGRGKVTNAKNANNSWHKYGLAADIICERGLWTPVDSHFWETLGLAAKRHGLNWGGTWKFVDRPHIQLGAPMRQSPSAHASHLLATRGVQGVWDAVGAL